MYSFKTINLSIDENIFNDICFTAINETKLKYKINYYIPITISSNILEVNSKNKINYEIINNINKLMLRKNYKPGIDYIIAILIDET